MLNAESNLSPVLLSFICQNYSSNFVLFRRTEVSKAKLKFHLEYIFIKMKTLKVFGAVMIAI